MNVRSIVAVGAVFLLLSGPVSTTAARGKATTSHTFAFGGNNSEEFLLDGKPFQIIAGEMHPSRVPHEYWRHRIRMAKAMGLNTVAIYIFWNDYEQQEGTFDFITGNRNIGEFLTIAKEEGVWVVLRSGPYSCGEWDFGGIPTYLLRYLDLKLRTIEDSRYTKAVERYLDVLVGVVRPYLLANGGPILMVQIENEYGSYQRRDHRYMVWLRDLWVKEGVPGPFFTGDGASESCLKDVVIPGVAVGLDPGLNENHWNVARKMNPGVPVFSAETYPGWLRHWGEGDWSPTNVSDAIKFYMETKKSFNLYMFHGGTNFGFTAGANHEGPGGYQPCLTSYDFGAPLDEQGRPTPAYRAIRKQLASYLPSGEALPEIPAPIPTLQLPRISFERWTSIWDQMPRPIEAEQPTSFESLGQNQGLMVYRTKLAAGAKGMLRFKELNDYAQVFIDGKCLGTLDRCKGRRELKIPDVGGRGAVLEVLVEGMGHINYNIAMEQDRKGIVGSVKLGDTVLTHWQMFPFPLQEQWATMARVRLIQKTVGRRNADGSTSRKKTSTWYLDYGHGDVRSTGITDKKIAEQLRAREEARLVLSSHGLPVPGDHKRLLLDLLKDYEAKLAIDNCSRYVRGAVSIIRKIIKTCRWRTALSIKEADANHYAVKLREKCTARTTHSHLASIKGFTRWLVQQGKLPADPLANVKKPSPRREMRRRMLLPDEWRELRKTTLAEGKELHHLSAMERVLLEATAIQTGYRHNELRSLSHGNFFLDGDEPFITCASANTKNRKDAKQYIKSELAQELRASFDEHRRVFCMPNPMYVAPMLRADLAAARAAWLKEAKDDAERARREASDFLLPTNHAGEVLDFHSLRHTTGAWLALAGCHPKVIQTVMRHSSITLTMDAYGHLFPGQVADAIRKLPDMMND